MTAHNIFAAFIMLGALSALAGGISYGLPPLVATVHLVTGGY